MPSPTTKSTQFNHLYHVWSEQADNFPGKPAHARACKCVVVRFNEQFITHQMRSHLPPP